MSNITKEQWVKALKYFNYKDAYTGERLDNINIDYIISLSNNGEKIIENIVSCNTETKLSKGKKDMVDWYIQQPYFSEYRLQKILKWMKNYKEYLKEPKGISLDSILNKQPQRFKITLPDGQAFTRTIYYLKKSNTYERTQILNDVIFNYWNDYFRDQWLDDKYKKYNSTKQILERCGTFLLGGQLKDSDVLSVNAIDRINDTEVSLSNSSFEIQQLVGQIGNDNIYTNFDNEFYHTKSDENLFVKTKKNKRKLQFKNTINAKLNNLYDSNEFETYKVTTIKNKDMSYIDENGDVKQIPPPSNINSNDELLKWQNSNAKNIFNENILIDKCMKIDGRKSIIDTTKPYIAEWCIVDIDNKFIFKGVHYKIDDQVEQYKVWNTSKIENNELNDFTNESLMDKILCIYSEDKYYFFDENIDRIKNNSIT